MPITPELKAAYLDAWRVLDAYATAGLARRAKVDLLEEVTARHGGPEMVGAVAFLGGSVLLQMIARLEHKTLDELRADIGRRLPDLLDDLNP